MVFISPNFQNTDFTYPLTLDNKITVFFDRIFGWQLEIADKCINGEKDASGNVTRPVIEGSGLAVLSIVLSYFETIATFREGHTGRKSAKYFKKGVLLVFPQLSQHPQTIVNDILNKLYSGTRCGLYHSSIIRSKILLTGEFTSALGYDTSNKILVINPHLLIPELKRYLGSYEHELRNPRNTRLRRNFETRYDSES